MSGGVGGPSAGAAPIVFEPGFLEPSVVGYIETTLDAIVVLEACRRRILSRVHRRLNESERHLVRSGSIFVFHEGEGNIKRWTDGLVWSPSRILGNFLIYRELDKKSARRKRGGAAAAAAAAAAPADDGATILADDSGSQYPHAPFAERSDVDPVAPAVDASPTFPGLPLLAPAPLPLPLPGSDMAGAPHPRAEDAIALDLYGPTAPDRASVASPLAREGGPRTSATMSEAAMADVLEARKAAALRRSREKALLGSLTGSPIYKQGGLMKKTISLAGLHLIAYYTVDDVVAGRLRTPSSLPELASLEISPDFLASRQFRQPPYVEIGPDGVPRYRAETPGHAVGPVVASGAIPGPRLGEYAAATAMMMPLPSNSAAGMTGGGGVLSASPTESVLAGLRPRSPTPSASSDSRTASSSAGSWLGLPPPSSHGPASTPATSVAYANEGERGRMATSALSTLAVASFLPTLTAARPSQSPSPRPTSPFETHRAPPAPRPMPRSASTGGLREASDRAGSGSSRYSPYLAPAALAGAHGPARYGDARAVSDSGLRSAVYSSSAPLTGEDAGRAVLDVPHRRLSGMAPATVQGFDLYNAPALTSLSSPLTPHATVPPTLQVPSSADYPSAGPPGRSLSTPAAYWLPSPAYPTASMPSANARQASLGVLGAGPAALAYDDRPHADLHGAYPEAAGRPFHYFPLPSTAASPASASQYAEQVPRYAFPSVLQPPTISLGPHLDAGPARGSVGYSGAPHDPRALSAPQPPLPRLPSSGSESADTAYSGVGVTASPYEPVEPFRPY